MNNSFIENVNYVASLDNRYGKSVHISKNNLSLRTDSCGIDIKFSYYKYSTKELIEVSIPYSNITISEIEETLLNFKSQIIALLGGNKFICNVFFNYVDLTVNNVAEITVDIFSNEDIIKIYGLNITITSGSEVLYNINGKLNDTLKVLPSLSMLTEEVINSSNLIVDNLDNIEIVANNINNVSKIGLVSDNISSVVISGENVLSINIVAENITDVQNAEENANIAKEKATLAIKYSDDAYYSRELAHKWAQELEDVIVIGEYGVDDKYSAYHWAKKAEAFSGGNYTIGGLYDVDSSGIQDGGMLIYDQSQNKYISYNFSNNDIIKFNTYPINIDITEGVLSWNKNDGVLSLGLKDGEILDLGQKNIRKVENATSQAIQSCTVVMSDGSSTNNDKLKVIPYNALKGSHKYVYGITTKTIQPNEEGFIVIDGKIKNINTTGFEVGEEWGNNDVLYVRPNGNGLLTNVEPGDDELKIIIGTVLKSHINGTIELRILPVDENIISKSSKKLENPVDISITGDCIGTASFDGSSNIEINVKNNKEDIMLNNIKIMQFALMGV